MTKMNEILNAIDNFNALVEEVQQVSDNNNEIARGNMQSALEFYIDKLQPYLEVATKLKADIYCGTMPTTLGENHIRLLGVRDEIFIQAETRMFKLKGGKLKSVNCDGFYEVGDTIVVKVLAYLDYMFGNGFQYFEKDFYRQVNNIMNAKMVAANECYKDSLKFKNLTER